jgi:hypothetical protein
VTPLPLATPNWSNQSLAPKFKPAFRIGARYMPNESNDIELHWTHHDSTTNDSFLASPTQMVGPPYLIGPESGLYKVGSGSVQSRYDAVNLDGGHTFCVECNLQFRVFGGVEVARIGQNLSGLFQSPDGLASSAYTTTSLFTGAGPRLGINGQYAFGDFQLSGELAGAGLIGSSQSQINFTTVSPAEGVNNQSLTSPNAIQLVPSIDAKLAAAYNFAPSQYGQFKVEVGYRAAVYFNAVGQYVMKYRQVSCCHPWESTWRRRNISKATSPSTARILRPAGYSNRATGLEPISGLRESRAVINTKGRRNGRPHSGSRRRRG